ncbi:hypothetical protein ABZ915_33840 [Streptomyces sp. NPDC046915]|uniref:hypothetical protein n=1 Tax=Streptomyces sp. NPDC046915 TaxID=3155257 RepID=UPI0033F1E579
MKTISRSGPSLQISARWALGTSSGTSPSSRTSSPGYALTDAAGYITGDNLTVSGGIGVHANA